MCLKELRTVVINEQQSRSSMTLFAETERIQFRALTSLRAENINPSHPCPDMQINSRGSFQGIIRILRRLGNCILKICMLLTFLLTAVRLQRVLYICSARRMGEQSTAIFLCLAFCSSQLIHQLRGHAETFRRQLREVVSLARPAKLACCCPGCRPCPDGIPSVPEVQRHCLICFDNNCLSSLKRGPKIASIFRNKIALLRLLVRESYLLIEVCYSQDSVS